jgi:hypothetical protein
VTVTTHQIPTSTEPLDVAQVISAIHRAEQLAVRDPANIGAESAAAELADYLPRLIDPAERRLTRMDGRTPADLRARDVLADTIRHARSVLNDETLGRLTNPTARLHLLAGACRDSQAGLRYAVVEPTRWEKRCGRCERGLSRRVPHRA